MCINPGHSNYVRVNDLIGYLKQRMVGKKFIKTLPKIIGFISKRLCVLVKWILKFISNQNIQFLKQKFKSYGKDWLNYELWKIKKFSD